MAQPTQPFLGGRQRFQVAFRYSSGDAITTTGAGGAVGISQAESLLGSGEDTIFPAKYLYFPPQQSCFVTVANLTTETLLVQISYHALVWRFAQ
jgi:hypothetical protein